MTTLCRGEKPHKREKPVENVSEWLKLAAVFVVNTIILTPESTFGILYDHLTEKYETGRSGIGWVLSVYMASGTLLGLLVSPLIDVYGCRPVSVVSSCLMALGMSLCALASCLPLLVAFYGVLAGLGFGGLFLVSHTVVQQCFPYNRGLATGISSLGYTIGAIVSPLLMEHLLREYPLSGALLLHGAVYVQNVAFAACLGSPRRLLHECTACGRTTAADVGSGSRGGDPDRAADEAEGSDEEGGRRPGGDADKKMSLTSFEDGVHQQTKAGLASRPPASQLIRTALRQMFDLTLLRRRAYVLTMFYVILTLSCRIAMLSHVVGASLRRGIPADQSAYLVSAMGFSNLCFRLASAVIMNFRWFNPLWYTAVGAISLAGSAFLAAFARSHVAFVCVVILMGAFDGVSNTVLPMVLVHVVGIQLFTKAFAVLRVFSMPFVMASTPFTGWLVDTTGDYRATYLFMGSACCLSVMLIVPAERLRKNNSQ